MRRQTKRKIRIAGGVILVSSLLLILGLPRYTGDLYTEQPDHDYRYQLPTSADRVDSPVLEVNEPPAQSWHSLNMTAPSKAEVSVLIGQLASKYGVDPVVALRIAKCESGLDPFAKNQDSSATGIYQWTIGTWEYIGSPGDRLNAEDNIRAFMIHYPSSPSWWVCK